MDQLIKIKIKIGQLPTVLQNEVWEYVRGDRAHWKQIFKRCIDVVPKFPTFHCPKCGHPNWDHVRAKNGLFIWNRCLELSQAMRWSFY